MLLIINLLIFFLASIVFFTAPGILVLSKIRDKFSNFETLILGTTLGYVLFTGLSYLLFVFHLKLLLLPIFISLILIFYKDLVSQILEIKTWTHTIKITPLIILSIVGIIGQLLVIAPSGLRDSNRDIYFYSAHGHDGPWHIAVMEQYQKGFPLINPAFAPDRLVNYHFFSDIAPAEFNYYFKTPSLDLYFRFFPLLFSILLIGLTYIFVKRMGGSERAAFWSVFFSVFCGSFGYIITFLRDRSIGGESLFWASQIQSSIGNPPQIVSFILMLAFLILFINFERIQDKLKNHLFLLFSLVILAGTISVFKVYAGVILLFSLGVVAFYQLVINRSTKEIILLFCSTFLALVLYLPNTQGSSSFLIFQPFWYTHTLAVASDKLNWIDIELRRQTYLSEHNYKRVLSIEVSLFLIFLVGNLGTRILSSLSYFKLSKNLLKSSLNQLLILISLTSILLPTLFLQSGVANNTIQFFQYILLISGILAGFSVDLILSWIKNQTINKIFITILIILSIPSQLGLLYSFYSHPPLAKINLAEQNGLNYLNINSKADEIILTAPFNKEFKDQSTPPEIWQWFDTSYVSAFSERPTFFSDKEQVDIMGYKYQSRLDLENQIFKEQRPQQFNQLIKQTGANYLYFPKKSRPVVNLDLTNLIPFYTNNYLEIWKIP